MDIRRTAICPPGHTAAAAVLAAVMLLTPAVAQERQPPPAENPGLIATIGRWFDRQAEYIGSTFRHAGTRFDSISQEAGIAARSTVDGAKDAAGSLARIPNTRVVRGHEKCRIAANGAPDCRAAADAVCSAKGFTSGRSLDMTTAEVCPPQVWMSGRSSGAGCRDETFVSRALCQ